MCPSLIEIGSKTAEKNSAQTNRQTNRQTDRQTDTTKIMVTWPYTNNVRLLLVFAGFYQVFPLSRQKYFFPWQKPNPEVKYHSTACTNTTYLRWWLT